VAYSWPKREGIAVSDEEERGNPTAPKNPKRPVQVNPSTPGIQKQQNSPGGKRDDSPEGEKRG